MQAGVALSIEASNPPMGALARDPHCPGDVGNGHPELADAVHEQPATVHRETGITVRHEDLLVVKRQTPQCPEVFTR